MVSYDSPEAVAAKLKYIADLGLGGAMWWEANGDKPENSTGSNSLVKAAVDEWVELESITNNLYYPESQYDNLRGGMI
jgi:chitinase